MEGLTAVRATAVATTPILLIPVAGASATLSQPLGGLNDLAEAASIVETTEERRDEAELQRLGGDLPNAIDDQAGADQSHQKTLPVSRRQSAKAFEILAAISLARFWRDHGKPIEARELFLPIYGWFTEGFDTPVLKDTKALLDQPTAPHRTQSYASAGESHCADRSVLCRSYIVRFIAQLQSTDRTSRTSGSVPRADLGQRQSKTSHNSCKET
jgi:hypothetical protein